LDVAPPDRHLIIETDCTLRTPRGLGKTANAPAFSRSVPASPHSTSYGPDTIGRHPQWLIGTLDAGLLAIKRRGG